MKLSGFAEMGIGVGSLPVWERGLKLGLFQDFIGYIGSLPVWERGLKLNTVTLQNVLITVAPRVGAWIETDGTVTPAPIVGRSPCGSVD